MTGKERTENTTLSSNHPSCARDSGVQFPCSFTVVEHFVPKLCNSIAVQDLLQVNIHPFRLHASLTTFSGVHGRKISGLSTLHETHILFTESMKYESSVSRSLNMITDQDMYDMTHKHYFFQINCRLRRLDEII